MQLLRFILAYVEPVRAYIRAEIHALGLSSAGSIPHALFSTLSLSLFGSLCFPSAPSLVHVYSIFVTMFRFQTLVFATLAAVAAVSAVPLLISRTVPSTVGEVVTGGEYVCTRC